MATIQVTSVSSEVDYPDGDGRPMAETPQHRKNMTYVIEAVDVWFERDPMVYVSGNMFIYYVPGNRLRHVAPDVFVVRGIPKSPERRRFLTWEEGKGPDLVIEVTSESTREQDMEDKYQIYQDVLKVREYFLFDPFEEYLEPALRGYRLVEGRFVAIELVNGRLPSEVLGLHLDRAGWLLRLYNPATGQWLPTPPEEREARRRAEAESERLRHELEALRRQLPPQS